MKRSAQLFLGSHDWTAFSAAQTDAESRVRTITLLDVRQAFDRRAQQQIVEIEAVADGFLRYMVRSIAGTLLAVGRGELDDEAVKRAIDTGERSLAAATAPACGLTLVAVQYD
jgi:tRNA pseudouridine38-40 synthase